MTYAKPHYHVGHNMPGYLPESEVSFAPTKTYAVELLKSEKEHWLASDMEGEYRFEGNAAQDLGYWVYRDGDLAQVFWAQSCHDTQCTELAKSAHWY